MMLKRTPLYAAHQKLGGKLIEFGGWEMPVQYTSIVDEHQAVRTAAGLFDISHMGEVLVTGHKAAAFLNRVLTNDLSRLRVGQGQYTLLCNERGGVIDDLYAYCLAAREYLLVINASRIEEDVAWLERQLLAFLPDKGIGDVVLGNVSANMGAVAVQGPRVAEFINRCCPANFVGGTIVQHCGELKKNEISRCRYEERDGWL
jgi:aminomethyltransferase